MCCPMYDLGYGAGGPDESGLEYPYFCISVLLSIKGGESL